MACQLPGCISRQAQPTTESGIAMEGTGEQCTELRSAEERRWNFVHRHRHTEKPGRGRTRLPTYRAQCLASGTAYYRVLQADRNGAGRYSRVIALSTGGSPEWTVFPNPFRQGFTITVSKPETASLFNMQGQLIRRMQVSAGANYIEGNG